MWSGAVCLLWGPHLCPLGFALSPLACQWPALASCCSRVPTEATRQLMQLSAGGTRVLLHLGDVRWMDSSSGSRVWEEASWMSLEIFNDSSLVDFCYVTLKKQPLN